MDGAGRFAPSPSGDLHIGNLRTAILAWLFARSTGRTFGLRIEDLDRVRPGSEARQLDDLRAIGLDWDTESRQSERRELYAQALDQLRSAGRVYECYCSRREVAEATSAPHGPPNAYPGTCRELSEAQRQVKRRDRPVALRLRSDAGEFAIDDLLHGRYVGAVDDLVLVRGDGTPAYNLSVVVDDGAQGIDQVVRGDDLLSSSPRQAYLASLLGIFIPTYAHVPLALNAQGRRLAKRDGAVTLASLEEVGVGIERAYALMLESLGMPVLPLPELVETFDPAALPRRPWMFVPTSP